MNEPITLYLTFNVSHLQSHVEVALHGAKKAMTTISLSDTWEVALERIKWVMDTVSPVAEVCYDVLWPIIS